MKIENKTIIFYTETVFEHLIKAYLKKRLKQKFQSWLT